MAARTRQPQGVAQDRCAGPSDRPGAARDHVARSADLPLRLWHHPGLPERFPIQRAYAEAGLAPGPVFPSFPPDDLIRRYGSLPLVSQPGERWLYHARSENLGVLVAR